MLDGKAAIPLYVQLEEQIQEKILSGIYQPGEKLQTEGEMAKTVSYTHLLPNGCWPSHGF